MAENEVSFHRPEVIFGSRPHLVLSHLEGGVGEESPSDSSKNFLFLSSFRAIPD